MSFRTVRLIKQWETLSPGTVIGVDADKAQQLANLGIAEFHEAYEVSQEPKPKAARKKLASASKKKGTKR